jgi:hypothetical protein
MADTLVERVTGQTPAKGVPVEVTLVMTDRTLLGSDVALAELVGYGPLPAPLTRDWLRETEADTWLRRLFATPTTRDPGRDGLDAALLHRQPPPLPHPPRPHRAQRHPRRGSPAPTSTSATSSSPADSHGT